MNRSRFKLDQNHAPIHEALEKFLRMRVVPFDVPGHKRGRGNPELTEFLGQKCVGVDFLFLFYVPAHRRVLLSYAGIFPELHELEHDSGPV